MWYIDTIAHCSCSSNCDLVFNMFDNLTNSIIDQELVNVDGKNYGEELTQLGLEVESFEERRGRILAEIKSIDEKLRKLGNEISSHVSYFFEMCYVCSGLRL